MKKRIPFVDDVFVPGYDTDRPARTRKAVSQSLEDSMWVCQKGDDRHGAIPGEALSQEPKRSPIPLSSGQGRKGTERLDCVGVLAEIYREEIIRNVLAVEGDGTRLRDLITEFLIFMNAMMDRLGFSSPERQVSSCEYCGRSVAELKKDRVADGKLTKDHIIPKAAGGTNARHNIAYVCSDCNSRKGSLMPWVWMADLARSEDPLDKIRVAKVGNKLKELMVQLGIVTRPRARQQAPGFSQNTPIAASEEHGTDPVLDETFVAEMLKIRAAAREAAERAEAADKSVSAGLVRFYQEARQVQSAKDKVRVLTEQMTKGIAEVRKLKKKMEKQAKAASIQGSAETKTAAPTATIPQNGEEAQPSK